MSLKLLASATAIACLTVTTAFAAPIQGTAGNVAIEQKKCTEFEKDPVKALECRKEKVQSLLRDGKITKEEAAEMTARIDKKIAKMKEFDKLTVPQKRAKLTDDFKASINNRVKEGKLTQEKAERLIKEFNENVAKWDGNGFPRLPGKWFKNGKHHMKDKPNMKVQPVVPQL